MYDWLIENSEQAVAVSTVINAVAATLAVLIALLSICLTVWTIKSQNRHNRLSVQPILSIIPSDYVNRISVKIRNDGSGPLRVELFEVTDGSETKFNLIDWMPKNPENIYWAKFQNHLNGVAVLPGEETFIIDLDGDIHDPVFVKYAQECRKILSGLSLRIIYTDVYNSRFPDHQSTLTWFGRTLESSE